MTIQRFAPLIAFTLAGIATPVQAYAQAPATPPALPEFEVTSIKPNTSGTSFMMVRPAAGGRFTATNVNLKTLIALAYKAQNFEISGGPGWVDSARFDVEAKAEGNPGGDQMALMLQTLLEDRFKLMVHRETKDLPVYALSVAKGGLKLKEATEGTCTSSNPDKQPPAAPGKSIQGPSVPCGSVRMSSNRLEGGMVSMPQLVNALSTLLARPVIDKTGLKDTFEVHLEWAPDGSTPGRGAILGPGGSGGTGDSGSPLPQADTSGPSIFTALQEQLGLRLESQKGPVATLVIDHADKPSEN